MSPTDVKQKDQMMVNASEGAEAAPEKEKQINVVIGTPKGTLPGKFEPTDTIADVIDYAVEKKQLGGADAFELYLRNGDDKHLLTPVTATLASFGVKSGAKLILAAHGSGV